MPRISKDLKIKEPATIQWIEQKLQDVIFETYKNWSRRARTCREAGLPAPAEPVLTVGALTDELDQRLGPDEWETAIRKYRYHAVELACKRLATSGQLQCSTAMKGKREARAYEPRENN